MYFNIYIIIDILQINYLEKQFIYKCIYDMNNIFLVLILFFYEQVK